MSGHVDVLLTGALVIVAVMVLTWLVSIVVRDAGVVDVVWGPGLVAVAAASALVGDGSDGRTRLLVVMVAIWGIRLGAHLLRRRIVDGPDRRYETMRRVDGDRYAIRSLVTVFGLQGVVMWLVALPVMLAVTPADPEVGWIGVIGVGLWGVGLFFEVVADAQLTRFRADSGTETAVLDTGLWRYSRHPNYFGELCVWWGVFAVAAESGDALIGVIGPIVLTVSILKVTGVPMLERTLPKRRPGYAAYVTRTSPLVPRRPTRERVSS